ncbi:MAG: PRC-barrel domain-containing protein [Actinomycetota bacterium]
MRQGIGDKSAEQSLRRKAELGRLLAAAEGYRVVASDGVHLGWLDHVRYERHADYPDEIVVRRRGLLPKRRRALPFGAVEAVRPKQRTVELRLDRSALEGSPSA